MVVTLLVDVGRTHSLTTQGDDGNPDELMVIVSVLRVDRHSLIHFICEEWTPWPMEPRTFCRDLHNGNRQASRTQLLTLSEDSITCVCVVTQSMFVTYGAAFGLIFLLFSQPWPQGTDKVSPVIDTPEILAVCRLALGRGTKRVGLAFDTPSF